jgi:Mg2+ and Co2+ transporter CorA
MEKARRHLDNNPVTVVVLYSIIEREIHNYHAIVDDIERELMHMENIPRSEIPADFLEHAFQLKKDVTGLVSNLLHLKEILGLIDSKRVPLEGFTSAWEEMFDLLEDEVGFLVESANNAKENLLSIIDLHINRTDYETNRILKILAVITMLGVIPASISGVLGANLLDAPYSVDLWQIVGVIIILLVFTAYVFIKLDWLK